MRQRIDAAEVPALVGRTSRPAREQPGEFLRADEAQQFGRDRPVPAGRLLHETRRLHPQLTDLGDLQLDPHLRRDGVVPAIGDLLVEGDIPVQRRLQVVVGEAGVDGSHLPIACVVRQQRGIDVLQLAGDIGEDGGGAQLELCALDLALSERDAGVTCRHELVGRLQTRHRLVVTLTERCRLGVVGLDLAGGDQQPLQQRCGGSRDRARRGLRRRVPLGVGLSAFALRSQSGQLTTQSGDENRHKCHDQFLFHCDLTPQLRLIEHLLGRRAVVASDFCRSAYTTGVFLHKRRDRKGPMKALPGPLRASTPPQAAREPLP